MIADVGYPVVAAYVVEAEDVEAVEAKPNVTQHLTTAEVLVFVVDKTVVHTDVEASVSRSTEGVSLQTCVWWAERQAVGKGGLEVHLPSRSAGEVVGEEEVDVVALVGGLRDALSVQVHAGFHQSEAYP